MSSTERDADSDFPRPANGGVVDHAIESDRGEQQRDSGEESGQKREQAFANERIVDLGSSSMLLLTISVGAADWISLRSEPSMATEVESARTLTVARVASRSGV